MRAMILDASAEIDESPPPLTLREVEPPRPGERELRVRVTACAVCRTDLHVIEGDLPERIRPIIPGHQAVGVVDELGGGCTRFALGDRVGIAWLRSTDGTCRFCRGGRENLCPDSRYTGYDADGGYAEYATAFADHKGQGRALARPISPIGRGIDRINSSSKPNVTGRVQRETRYGPIRKGLEG